MRKIVVKISKATPVITVVGCKGPSCKLETADLERALGKKTKDTPTREMTQHGTQDATLHQ
jgi:hypothetical protein